MRVVYTIMGNTQLRNHVLFGSWGRAIFLIKLATKIFIISHTSERMGVLQVKKDNTLELLWEKCEISMVKVGRNFTSL
jgi:hypothetical protein